LGGGKLLGEGIGKWKRERLNTELAKEEHRGHGGRVGKSNREGAERAE
jgi:hypothetical protein